MRIMRIMLGICAVSGLLVAGTNAPVQKKTAETAEKAVKPSEETKKVSEVKEAQAVKKPTKAILDTSLGTIEFTFLTDKAPNTCDNFIKLAQTNFYDGVTFHRVIPNFMIQSGCPNSKKGAKGIPGTGGPGYNIKAEFNDTKHVPGIVSMARSADPDSAGSQFFICVNTCPHLDGKYTAFGKVTKGYDVVEKISKVETGAMDKPIEDVVIKSIRVE